MIEIIYMLLTGVITVLVIRLIISKRELKKVKKKRRENLKLQLDIAESDLKALRNNGKNDIKLESEIARLKVEMKYL